MEQTSPVFITTQHGRIVNLQSTAIVGMYNNTHQAYTDKCWRVYAEWGGCDHDGNVQNCTIADFAEESEAKNCLDNIQKLLKPVQFVELTAHGVS